MLNFQLLWYFLSATCRCTDLYNIEDRNGNTVRAHCAKWASETPAPTPFCYLTGGSTAASCPGATLSTSNPPFYWSSDASVCQGKNTTIDSTSSIIVTSIYWFEIFWYCIHKNLNNLVNYWVFFYSKYIPLITLWHRQILNERKEVLEQKVIVTISKIPQHADWQKRWDEMESCLMIVKYIVKHVTRPLMLAYEWLSLCLERISNWLSSVRILWIVAQFFFRK